MTSNKRATLFVLALADLMVVLDTSVVYVALAFGGFLLLGGRVADRFGRRRVFVSGVAGFVAASLLCGLATSPGVLIAGRAAEGLAAAFMAPAALSLVMVTFAEGDERNRALGVWGAIASTGAAVGLVAGGALVSWLSWRLAFFVNVPIGAFAAVASLFLIAETREPVTGGWMERGRYRPPAAWRRWCSDW